MSPNSPQKYGGSPNRPGGQQGKGGSPASSTALVYPLPKEVVDVFTKAPAGNPGLVFERFAPDISQAKEREKSAWREQALKKAQSAPDPDALKAAYARWQALAQACNAQTFTLKTDWRFIPGLGRKTALEIGFGFHRYGFPYLPASSVKGIARTWALFELALLLSLGEGKLNDLDQTLSKEDKEFDKALEHFRPSAEAEELAKTIRLVFGTLDRAGGAVFFDAMPTVAFSLDIDIMNPHYAPYYQGKEPPGDWHNPTPITFLAVPKDKEFAFAVAWRRGAPRADLLEQACTWLKNGLRDLGAGAKTSAGYGFFREEREDPKQELLQKIAVSSPALKTASTERLPTRYTATGKVRYEGDKAYVVNEEGKRWRLKWNELGMNSLPAKAFVEIEYELYEDGNYKVVRVVKK